MGYYIGEIMKLRKEFFDSFNGGEYSTAIKKGGEILKIYKDNNDCKSLEYANDINNLAIAYDTVTMYDRAIQLYREAADIREKRLGEKSAALADTLSNWGAACSMKKMVNEAYGLHKRALQIRRDALDENHEDVIMSLYNMGSACEDIKRYERAQQYLEEAAAKAEKQPKISRSDYADILLGCGRVLEARGLYIKALSYCGRAVEIIKMEEGEKSFYYLSSVLDTAALCDKAKLYDRSIMYFKRAVDVRKRLLDKNHLDFITNLNALAAVYRKQGNGRKAFEVHKEVLGLIKNLLGAEHPFYAECISNMGSDCAEFDNFEMAEEYFKEAIELRKKDGDSSVSGYTVILSEYAAMLIKKGDMEKAEEVLEEMLDLRKRKFGDESVIFASALGETAAFYVRKKMFNKAASYYREAIEIILASEKKKDMELADMYADLAEVMAELENSDYALKYSDESVSLRRKLKGAVHPEYAEGLYRAALVKRKFNLKNAAAGLLEDAVRILKESLGDDHEDTKEAMLELAEVYLELSYESFGKKDAEAAVKHFEKAEELYNTADKDMLNEIKSEFAFLYAFSGNMEKAENMLNESEEYVLKKYGENSREYAYFLKDNGKFHVKFGSFEKGEKLLFKAMEILYSAEGEDNALQSEISLFMGESCIERGRYKKAEEYFKAAAPHAEGIDYAKAFTGLGKCFLKNGRIEEAKEKLLSAKKYMEEYTGYENNCYGETLMLLGSICEKQGDIESACRYCSLSVSNRRLNGEKGEAYRKDLIKLASLQKKTGQKDEAASLIKEAAELTADGKEKGKLLIRCAKLNAELKKYDFAISLLQKAEALYEKAYGYASDERGAVVYDEAILCIKAGRNEEAILFFDMLREILKENPASRFADDRYFDKYKKIMGK